MSESEEKNPDALQSLITVFPEGETTAFELAELASGGKELRITRTENKLAPIEPVRVETPARAHTTHTATGLLTYLQQYGGKNTVVYVDFTKRQAFAVLDEHAEGGIEIIQLRPQIHPRFMPWFKMIGNSVPMPDFVDFIRRNRKTIIEPNGRALILQISQLKSTKTTELQQGKGITATNGIMVTYKVDGKVVDSGVVEFPEQLKLITPIFVGTKATEVELDIVLDSPGTEPDIFVELVSADLEEAMVAEFDRLAEQLNAATILTDLGGRVVLGSPDYRSWDYLR